MPTEVGDAGNLPSPEKFWFDRPRCRLGHRTPGGEARYVVLRCPADCDLDQQGGSASMPGSRRHYAGFRMPWAMQRCDFSCARTAQRQWRSMDMRLILARCFISHMQPYRSCTPIEILSLM